MLEHMTSREITEWQEFAKIEPIGEAREDQRNARLLTLIANVNRDPEKRPEPFTPQDFMIDYWENGEEEKEESDVSRNIAIAEMFAAAGLGTITRDSKE